MAITMTNGDPATLAFRFTSADLAVLPTDLPSGALDYELNDGQLVIRTIPTAAHAICEGNIGFAVIEHCNHLGIGKCRLGTGLELWKDPDRLVRCDVAFFSCRSLPIRSSPAGFIASIPELVVEVRSKNDSDSYIAEKVRDYVKAGVQVLWVVEPDKRAVIEHRAHGATTTFAQSDTLMAEDIFPGFRMAVADIFQE